MFVVALLAPEEVFRPVIGTARRGLVFVNDPKDVGDDFVERVAGSGQGVFSAPSGGCRGNGGRKGPRLRGLPTEAPPSA